MSRDGEDDRYPTKRDRTARLMRLVAILHAHPEGIKTAEVAERVGMSVRTVYRDLKAIEGELGVPLWAEDGRWGVDQEKAFLPPLRLTQSEAMAVVLAARLMVRYADKYDPDLAAAFEKLEQGLPPALAEHVERTLDVMSKAPRDEVFSDHVRRLTKAWAERRVVELAYEPANYAPEAAARRAIVHPYLIEPSLQTHALYLIGFDETRGGLRTFKIERIREVALTARTFDPPEAGTLETSLRRAWDIIADQEPTDVVLRFREGVATRVLETTWHPTQRTETADDGSLIWRATVAGPIEIRLWILSWGDDVTVLEPVALRDDVAATHRRAAERYADRGGAAS
ncbi:MAG TPA: WYL domain-containing protein [Candidatus Saccharimonadales bacterium]|nr:WYL domain-containing protein [Candidatus Saccharimonadales bacterium]